MNDFIRREAVIDVLKETGIIQDNDIGRLVIDEINRIPMACNIDKIVDQLKESYSCGTKSLQMIPLSVAIRIVRKGGVESQDVKSLK